MVSSPYHGVLLQVPESIVFVLFPTFLWLGLIWSCFVFCLLFLLFYVICAPVLTEGTLTMTNKHLAMQTFAEFYVLKKRKDPLDQLCNGLENLGILSLIRGYPSLMKPYFVAHELPSLTSKGILDSCSYRMVSEPDDERSVRADRFMQQAVLKLEEGTVTKTFNNT